MHHYNIKVHLHKRLVMLSRARKFTVVQHCNTKTHCSAQYVMSHSARSQHHMIATCTRSRDRMRKKCSFDKSTHSMKFIWFLKMHNNVGLHDIATNSSFSSNSHVILHGHENTLQFWPVNVEWAEKCSFDKKTHLMLLLWLLEMHNIFVHLRMPKNEQLFLGRKLQNLSHERYL